MKRYEDNARRTGYAMFAGLLLLILLALLSCTKEEIQPEECWICDVEVRDFYLADGGAYIVWEFWKEEIFCEDVVPPSGNDVIRYINCRQTQ